MPPLTTRLPLFAREVVSNLCPFLSSKLIDEVYQLFVLLGCPMTVKLVTLCNSPILYLTPAVKTLFVSPALDVLGNFHPISFAIFLHSCYKPLVLLLRPVCAAAP